MLRNPLTAGRSRWAVLAITLTSFVGLFVVTSGAEAVVVNDNGVVAGVSLVPSARAWGSTTAAYLKTSGVPEVTSSGPCADPAAGTEPDILTNTFWPLSSPAQPICWHNGPVMHQNETFTLEWEGQSPNTYWSTTKNYVQDFLGDVAAASGQLVNPYSDTTQYWDGGSVQDRAAYNSVFGGGCDDNGTAKCQFGSVTGSGPGNPLPASDCPVRGDNLFGGVFGGGPYTITNNRCLTDADVQNEVKSLIDNDGLISHTEQGYTPLVNVLTPPGVVVCLDSAGKLCSSNSQLTPPPPVISTATTGGTVTAGTYQVVISYVTSTGEQAPSASASVTTSGGTSTMTIASPPPEAGVTGWYAYVTQSGGSVYSRQGGVNTIGQSLTLTTQPVGGGATPPTGSGAFCSYHSDVAVGGQTVSYVVQPWTAFTTCDEPDVPAPSATPTPPQLEKIAGQALASPLSQSGIAAIVNPQLNGWFGLNGLEIDDQNACQPWGQGLDTFSFGTSGQGPYYLQRESNNTSVVDNDPYTYNGCLPVDTLAPAFVAPTAISLGDTIDLDGSDTGSSLAIPNANYKWTFGDGTSGTGPSVEHTYAAAGNYTVTLTVIDRGGNQASVSQTVAVLGASGLPNPPSNPGTQGGTTKTGNTGTNGALSVRLQLLPQGLRSVLRHGMSVQVKSNASANGIATVFISRALARRLHLHVGRGKVVVIGEGTVWQVTNGTVLLHFRLSHGVVKKLKRLKHATLNVRLALVSAGGDHLSVDAAGHY